MSSAHARRPAPKGQGLLVILLIVLLALFIRSVANTMLQQELGGTITAPSRIRQNPTVIVPASTTPSESVVKAASVPLELRIPRIGVEANVQIVGLTEFGQMDVPKGESRYEDVGWLGIGAKPGEVGVAVMDGHLDTYSLISPGVFRDLDELVAGDVVEVTDDRGNVFRFRVTGSKEFAAGDETTEVFESTSGKAHLNLITCSGDWKQSERQYDRRLVVFTELIP